MKPLFAVCLALSAALMAGCGKKESEAPPAAAHKHEHKPPHGGTPVVLGKEEFHLELVLDPASGVLQAFVFDGELENFVRIDAASFEIVAKPAGKEETLVFKPVANGATGEKAGDTALFEARADWLKTTAAFDAVLRELTVRSHKYQGVAFNFPKGNDTDEPEKK